MGKAAEKVVRNLERDGTLSIRIAADLGLNGSGEQ